MESACSSQYILTGSSLGLVTSDATTMFFFAVYKNKDTLHLHKIEWILIIFTESAIKSGAPWLGPGG